MSPVVIGVILFAGILLRAQMVQDKRRKGRVEPGREAEPSAPPTPPPALPQGPPGSLAPAPTAQAPAPSPPPPPLPPPPSLGGRVFLALFLMVGFYALALAIVAGLLYLPYAEWHFIGRLDFRLLAFALIGVAAILSGILPRVDRMRDPGPRLTRETQPRLFDTVAAVARATGQAEPRDVFLVPDLNAWVSERGGLMGVGRRRVMGLGLPLLETLSVTELRAVLAHEFGHFHGGDTALGPWLYKTRAAIERTIRNLTKERSWVRAPFVWYGNAFLRVTHAVSRRQELAADQLAARVVGGAALASGLKKIHVAAPFFQAYWGNEVAPVLQGGYRPPIGRGYVQFLSSAGVKRQADVVLAQALAVTATDPYDTHPPLRERLAALPEGGAEGEDPEPAISLLADPESCEPGLIAALQPEGAPALQPASWEEVNTAFWLPYWEQQVRSRQENLAKVTPLRLAGLAGHPARAAVLLQLIPDEAHGSDKHTNEAFALLAAALCVLLHRRGWRIRALPGQDVTLFRDTIEIQPFALLARLMRGEVSEDTWRTLWSTTGLGGEDLGALAASLPSVLEAPPPAAPPAGPRLEKAQRDALERRYADLADPEIEMMYQTGPAGLASPDAWELLVAERRRRRSPSPDRASP